MCVSSLNSSVRVIWFKGRCNLGGVPIFRITLVLLSVLFCFFSEALFLLLSCLSPVGCLSVLRVCLFCIAGAGGTVVVGGVYVFGGILDVPGCVVVVPQVWG